MYRYEHEYVSVICADMNMYRDELFKVDTISLKLKLKLDH